ncbi:MAG: hypothetical protein ACRDV7_03400 [Acidimicrobiia bacterium]
MRVLRRLVLLGVVLAVIALLVLVLTSRPDLEDAKKSVDTTWTATVEPLDARYALLAQATEPLRGRPGPAGALAEEVDAGLQNWIEARESENRADAIAAANELEGLGRRVVVLVNTSPTLAADPAAKAPSDAFAGAGLPGELTAFAEAVQAYEEARQGPVRSVVADVFGYDSMSTVAVSAPPTSA